MSSNTKPPKLGPLWKQLLWFIGLYIAALVVIGGFMFVVRHLLGMH